MNTVPSPKREADQDSLRASSAYLGLGAQLAATVLLYAGGGYLLDRWLHTTPWLLVAGVFVGMVAMFYQLLRLNQRLNRTRPSSPAPTESPPENPSRDG